MFQKNNATNKIVKELHKKLGFVGLVDRWLFDLLKKL
jgi:hypothetical protein